MRDKIAPNDHPVATVDVGDGKRGTGGMGEKRGRGATRRQEGGDREDPAILRQLYDPELSLHINGKYIRLPEFRKYFSKKHKLDDRRRRRGNWDSRSRLTGVRLSRMCTLLITLIASHPSPRRNKVPYECSPRRWLPFSSFRQILSRIVLWNGILEISVGERNRCRVQTRNIMGYEINLLDTNAEWNSGKVNFSFKRLWYNYDNRNICELTAFE